MFSPLILFEYSIHRRLKFLISRGDWRDHLVWRGSGLLQVAALTVVLVLIFGLQFQLLNLRLVRSRFSPSVFRLCNEFLAPKPPAWGAVL